MKNTLEETYKEHQADKQARADEQDNSPLGQAMRMYYQGKADAYESAAYTAKIDRLCGGLREGGGE